MLHLKGSHVAGDYPTPGGFETRLYGDVDYGWGAGRRPPSWGQGYPGLPTNTRFGNVGRRGDRFAGGWSETVYTLTVRLLLLGLLVLIVVAIPADDPAGRRDWRAFQAAEGNTLDLLDRQLELLFRTQVAVGGDPTDLELLVRYFDAARIVDELRRDAIRRAALGEPRSSNVAALAEAVREEASLRPAAMETLRLIVERELVSAGFDRLGRTSSLGSAVCISVCARR